MPGLLDSYNPYGPAPFDAYLKRQRTRTPEDIEQVKAKELLKGQVSGLLGMPMDLAQMGVNAWQAGTASPVTQDVPLTSEKIGGLLGADTSSPGFNVGLIGAPDPQDIARLGGKGLLAMTLFHGTPHKFDRFDLSKIGTGEGAQAYGHGLYFAESPGVAKTYRSAGTFGKPTSDLTADEMISLGKALERDGIAFKEPAINEAGYDWAKKIYDENWASDMSPQTVDLFERAMAKHQGHLYEVDIPDEVIEKMLDWDKPLSQQPENVKQAITKILNERGHEVAGAMDSTGAHSYKSLSASDDGAEFHNRLEEILRQSREPEYSKRTAEILHEHGIPGIRYFDGNARKAGEGTRNIVLFNPDDIRKVKRDGETVFDRLK